MMVAALDVGFGLGPVPLREAQDTADDLRGDDEGQIQGVGWDR